MAAAVVVGSAVVGPVVVGAEPGDDVVVGADAVLGGDESSGIVEPAGAASSRTGGRITLSSFLPVISTPNCHRLPSSASAAQVNSVSVAVDSGSSQSASVNLSSPAVF